MAEFHIDTNSLQPLVCNTFGIVISFSWYSNLDLVKFLPYRLWNKVANNDKHTQFGLEGKSEWWQ
jgi:hypothetical protein